MNDRSQGVSPEQTPDAVAFELNSVAIHLVRRLREADAALRVSPARLSALSVLVFGGEHSLGELAQHEQVTPPTMSRIVAKLEEAGLVERRPNLKDGRAVLLRATEKGRELMHRGRRLRVERLADQLRELPAADLETLAQAAAVLRRLEP